MKFFQPNLNRTGRIARAGFGLLCLVAGGWLWGHSWAAGLGLVAMGIFALIEAARGWCVVRACGIKTKF